MEEFLDIDMPFDWGVKSLCDLDLSLRCPICKEYFNNAIQITCCNHSCFSAFHYMFIII
jgi:hypothetical protein